MNIEEFYNMVGGYAWHEHMESGMINLQNDIGELVPASMDMRLLKFLLARRVQVWTWWLAEHPDSEAFHTIKTRMENEKRAFDFVKERIK